MKFDTALEYMLPAVQEALKDTDPYVRETAILGCCKINFMNESYILSIKFKLLYLLNFY